MQVSPPFRVMTPLLPLTVAGEAVSSVAVPERMAAVLAVPLGSKETPGPVAVTARLHPRPAPKQRFNLFLEIMKLIC